MKKIITICLIMFLSACGSNPPPETQYFVLTPHAQTNIPTNENSNKIVVLEPIKLAEFLDQPGIVMQTNSHQIKVAHYHRWAEPLKRNIRRFIADTLNGNLRNSVVQDEINLNVDEDVLSLKITVNQFNGKTDGSAILSGDWKLIGESNNTVLKTDTYNYNASLSNEGYTELVNQLAHNLEQLCSDLAKAIE